MTKLTNPNPVFFDGRGAPLSGGYLYVGAPDADPSVSPISAYWDQGLTIEAEQPLRTIGGLIVNGVTPASVFIDGTDFSLRVEDNDHILVSYSPSVYTDADQFQPKDEDLTAIAAQGTTAYGRSLLELANQAALIAAVGGNSYLPLSGGSLTGAIIRQGAGAHLFMADGGMTSGRVYTTNAGDPDPTSQPGDWWIRFS